MSSAAPRARRRRAREKYKPGAIRCLLVAEAPPSDDRYFYFEDVRDRDKLFVHAMKVLFPEEIEKYVGNRSSSRKAAILHSFQKRGFWLIDALEDPIPTGDSSTASYLQQRSDLLDRLAALRASGDIKGSTPLVIVKAPVYDAFFSLLGASGYRVVDERIYFPSNSREPEFESSFSKVVKSLKL